MLNKKLIKKLKIDKDFYNSYQANIAMSFVDEVTNFKRKTGKKSLSKEDIHIISNNAANNFLNLLFKNLRNTEIDNLLK